LSEAVYHEWLRLQGAVVQDEVSEVTDAGTPSSTEADILAARDELLERGAFQTEVEAPVFSDAPDWLSWLFDNEVARFLFKLLGEIFKIGFFVGIAALVIALIYIAYRVVRSRLEDRQPKKAPAKQAYAPSAAVLRDLLREADKLAAEGNHAAAARLLLHRSIEDFQRRRPDTIGRSMTAREIGTLDLLTASTRDAFGLIAMLVERAHYACLPISEADYANARASYDRIGAQRS